MSEIVIKSRWEKSILWRGEADSIRDAVQKAILSRANLTRANLMGANFEGADLMGANFEGANLVGANLTVIRDDFRAVLDAAPDEALGLRAALIRGNVDGSTYTGECACLVGTIANVRHCATDKLGLLKPDPDRPAERWFLAISPGDNRRNSQVVAITLGWLDGWLGEKGIKIPKRPKSIGEVARAMAKMTAAQRKDVAAYARSFGT